MWKSMKKESNLYWNLINLCNEGRGLRINLNWNQSRKKVQQNRKTFWKGKRSKIIQIPYQYCINWYDFILISIFWIGCSMWLSQSKQMVVSTKSYQFILFCTKSLPDNAQILRFCTLIGMRWGNVNNWNDYIQTKTTFLCMYCRSTVVL